jgi:hypothetical protein
VDVELHFDLMDACWLIVVKATDPMTMVAAIMI